MCTAVLPAAVNKGVCIANSSRFLIPWGSAPITGCNKTTANLTPPVRGLRSPAYCFDASSKLIGSSLGNVFLSLGWLFVGAALGTTAAPAALAAGATVATVGGGAAPDGAAVTGLLAGFASGA